MQWECFCDESYYGFWAVRPVGENRWGYCFHVASNKEAEGLRDLLNKKETTGGEMNQTTDTKTSEQLQPDNSCEHSFSPVYQCVHCGKIGDSIA